MCVDVGIDIAELVEQVESVQLQEQAVAFEKASGEFCIPYQMVVVQAVVVIPPSAEHGQVGVESDVPRQGDFCFYSVAIAQSIDVREIVQAAAEVIPFEPSR